MNLINKKQKKSNYLIAIIIPAIIAFIIGYPSGNLSTESACALAALVILLTISLLPSFTKVNAEPALTSLSIAALLGYIATNIPALGGDSIWILVGIILLTRIICTIQKLQFDYKRGLILSLGFMALVIFANSLTNGGFSFYDYPISSILTTILVPFVSSLPSFNSLAAKHARSAKK